MPRSKKRKHHHDYRPPANALKSKKNRSAVTVAIVFVAFIGMGIAYFAAGDAPLWPLWLAAGAIVGAFAGYYFGREIDKAFAKK
ncbi:MAG: hypothetical protein IPL84_00870 [Chitinophagaceae bacterium]|nr:hypothetical protein [Chitinophagaceae bacterium]